MSLSRRAQLELARRLMVYERSSSIIYFIRQGSDGPIKIGKTKDLEDRINALQICSPYKLEILCFIVAPDELEEQLHAYLSEYQLNGEWFEASSEVFEICELIRLGDLDGVLKKFEDRQKRT